jgi:hypothetical protein
MKTRFVLLALWVCPALSGCTHRAWYEGLQERQREECYRSANQADVQKCLDRVNAETYDDYRKERDKPTPEGKR